LDQVLVPFRITAFQVFQQAAAACDHRQQSPAGMMVFAMQLEVVLELQNALAQDGYLDFWRTGIGFVDSVICNYLFLGFGRQCHSRIDTPRLDLIAFVPLQDSTMGFVGQDGILRAVANRASWADFQSAAGCQPAPQAELTRLTA
jgi:hypothetical protein